MFPCYIQFISLHRLTVSAWALQAGQPLAIWADSELPLDLYDGLLELDLSDELPLELELLDLGDNCYIAIPACRRYCHPR